MLEFGLFGIIICILSIITHVMLIKKRILEAVDIIAGIVFSLYLLFLIKYVFFPIPFQKESIEIIRQINGEFTFNIVPFKSMITICSQHNLHNTFYQLGGNLLLLFPMGIYLSVLFDNINMKKLLLAICFTSIFVELVQFLIGLGINCQYRVVDIDDVILNIFGGILGLMLGKLLSPIYNLLCKQLTHCN